MRWGRRLGGLIRDRVEQYSGEIGYKVHSFAPQRLLLSHLSVWLAGFYLFT